VDVILALDPARKTGVAIGSPGARPFLSVVDFGRPLDDHADIFARALKWIDRALGERPTHLAIEKPIPPSGNFGFTTFATTEIALGLAAIFRGAARNAGLPIIEAPINSWRKYSLGNGRLKRKEAKASSIHMCRLLGWGDVGDDAAEAGMIWLWCCGQINPRLATRPEPLFAGVAS
jgi:hypothetical protein